MTERRRTLVPVAGAGLAAGVLLAVAATRPWFTAPDLDSDPFGTIADAGEMPLASALSLVLLACWGVVLFTRGVMRRAAAGLASVAALGSLVTVVAGWVTVPDQVTDAVSESALLRGTDTVSTSATGWFWVAALTAVVSVVATALAVGWCAAWPEMGSRYDAPTGRAPAETTDTTGERSHLDLWKSQDEGHDPTA